MSARALIEAGIDAAADPRLLQLYVDGKEHPLLVTGGEDGRFDPSDTVEYYGTGIDSSNPRTYYLVLRQTLMFVSPGCCLVIQP